MIEKERRQRQTKQEKNKGHMLQEISVEKYE